MISKSFSTVVLLVLVFVVGGCARTSGPSPAVEKAAEKWTQALSDADPKVRRDAAIKLGNVRASDPPAVAALCQALGDRDAVVRREAIVALSKLGPAAQAALPALKTLQRGDPDPKVRGFAAKAVEKLDPSIGQSQSTT